MPGVARMGSSWSCGDTQQESSGNVFVNGVGVARDTDLTIGHGCWPPVAIAESSSDVFVNNLGMARIGDAHATHTCPVIPETHGGTLTSGSGDTFCNGL